MGHPLPRHFRRESKSKSKATDRACPELVEGSVRPTRASVQLLLHWNLEVHQLGAFGAVDAGDVDVGASEGDVSEVEEEESGLGGMRLDGLGGELRGFDLIAFFLGDGAFHIFARDGERTGTSSGLGIGEAAVDVFGGSRCELGAIGGNERDLHVGDGDGLVAVIGDDEEDGKESVLAEVHRENFGLVGSVVGIGGDGDLFVGVIVVRGIGFGGAGGGLDEIFGGEGKCERCDRAEHDGSTAMAQFNHWLHDPHYRGTAIFFAKELGSAP